MAVIALRPRAKRGALTPARGAHPVLAGVFRSPTGTRGDFLGSLRLERLLITPHGAFVSGVVTGELTTSDGDPIGRDTRPITTAADLRRSEGRTVAVVRAFEVDMIGIPVRVASFTLDPGIAHPGAPARYPRERDTG